MQKSLTNKHNSELWKSADRKYQHMIGYSTLRENQWAVPKFSRELGRVSNFNKSINWHHQNVRSCWDLSFWPSMMLLGWTETKLWTWKYGLKSTQTSVLRQRPPKPHKLLKFVMISLILFEMGKHSDFYYWLTVGVF